MSSDSTEAGPPPGETTPRRFGNAPVFGLLAIGVVAVLFTLGWGTWMLNYTGAGYNVPHQVIAWDTPSETSASITFEVNASAPTNCLITALDETHVEVGQDEVELSEGISTVEHTFDTTRQASMVEVTSCRERSPE
ncbi:DUF4307 domain-containing protein [Lipingzhangella sp. LS1_29]|uniref:DUF4307 domain-containing protein n=1 Tax=Lipingzhangella rawalii TaxID=2055835 RepID=A0ABU2HAW1_9ACTN|nr:DUF4307 domain-containing protein [Lipingzhangella rawalii]MDS1272147.1 DUF4307 domain-containing protein [Lipingzhangella rawalii]